MKLVREILICCLLICGCACLFQGALFLQTSTKAAEATRKAAEGVDLMRVTLQVQLAGKYGLLSELTAAARESRKTIDVLQKTSLAERAKVGAFSDASIQAVNDLDTVARNAASTVQGLQGAVDQLGAVSAALKDDAVAAKPTIDGATALVAMLNAGSGQVLARVNATVGDLDARVKAIAPIEVNLESTSKHVDLASKSLAETLGFVEDNFRPRKVAFWQRMLDAATGGFFSVALHWIPQRVHEVN